MTVEPAIRRRGTPFCTWLYDAYLENVRSPPDALFHSTRFGLWYGQPFPIEDVNRATRWVDDRGLVRGTPTAEGFILRSRITTEGITMVESNRLVNDPEPGTGGGINVGSITGDGNAFMSSSPGTTMNVSTQITDDHRHQAIQLEKSDDPKIYSKNTATMAGVQIIAFAVGIVLTVVAGALAV